MLWYSLEAPHRGASNEYPQHMFSSRNKKDIGIFRMKKAPYLLLWKRKPQKLSPFWKNYQMYPILFRPKIKSVSCYPAVPNFSPPTLNFFKDFVGISPIGHIIFLLTSYKNF